MQRLIEKFEANADRIEAKVATNFDHLKKDIELVKKDINVVEKKIEANTKVLEAKVELVKKDGEVIAAKVKEEVAKKNLEVTDRFLKYGHSEEYGRYQKKVGIYYEGEPPKQTVDE